MNSFFLGVLVGIGLTVAANGITATYVLQTVGSKVLPTATMPEIQIQLDLMTREQAQFVATIISILLVVISFILQPLSKKINTSRMNRTAEGFHGAAWSFVLIHLVMTALGYEPLSALITDISPIAVRQEMISIIFSDLS